MKSVLISIKPKWCELIASGKKTIEVRKTAPKLETPFKCYIYATKPKKFIKGYADDDLFRHVDGRIECGFSFQLATEKGATVENNILSGKVIGEFVCDEVEKYDYFIDIPFSELVEGQYRHYLSSNDLEHTCLSANELEAYLGEKDGYGWHISQLKIYDTPKELGEFNRPCPNERYANSPDCSYDHKYCKYFVEDKVPFECNSQVTRPPQSWCYIEALETKN